MVLASSGDAYDAMKRVWLDHWASCAIPGARLWFLYGRGAARTALPAPAHDRLYDVAECVTPGQLEKTLCAFREALEDPGVRAVVRTNLSSVYAWGRLRAFLDAWDGDVAGFSDDFSHFSGCNMILSRRAVEALYAARDALRRDVEDDVTMSRALLAHADLRATWIARLDFLPHPVLKNARSEDEVFHARFKSSDRARDAEAMRRVAVGCFT